MHAQQRGAAAVSVQHRLPLGAGYLPAEMKLDGNVVREKLALRPNCGGGGGAEEEEVGGGMEKEERSAGLALGRGRIGKRS